MGLIVFVLGDENIALAAWARSGPIPTMSGRTGQPNSPRARKVNVVIYFIVGAIFAVLLVTSVFANGAVSAEAAGPLREERRLEKRAPVPPPNPKTPKFDYRSVGGSQSSLHVDPPSRPPIRLDLSF